VPQDSTNTNSYSFGRIGSPMWSPHAHQLDKLGPHSAAAVASQMKSVFTLIRFGLMVGIGGAVPSVELDVRPAMLSSASLICNAAGFKRRQSAIQIHKGQRYIKFFCVDSITYSKNHFPTFLQSSLLNLCLASPADDAVGVTGSWEHCSRCTTRSNY
jgi:hypothetical protein